MARPFKVLIPEQKEQFGVVARNLRLLRDNIQKRYGLKNGFKIFLTDGTAVDDEEYFAFLEPQTLLIVKHAVLSGETKTSVVDLTRNTEQVQALLCREDIYEFHKHHQHKDISHSNGLPTDNNLRTQVLSIQIAKVQGNVQWENEGVVQPDHSSTQPHTCQQLARAQSDSQTVTNASTIPLHHANPSPHMSSQTPNTYSTTTSRRPIRQATTAQQLQNIDVILRNLYHQQVQPQHHEHQQTQTCNAVLRPSQRYYIQQQQQQQQHVGRSNLSRSTYHVRHQASSGHNVQ